MGERDDILDGGWCNRTASGAAARSSGSIGSVTHAAPLAGTLFPKVARQIKD
jgi:hypothetical protein